MRVVDGLTSLVANLGTARDKAATSFYVPNVLTDAEAFAMYEGSALARNIVDLPAIDSCREWRDWQADENQIEAIEAEEKRLNLRTKVLQARKWARLFGGAAIYIGTDDQDASAMLDPNRMSKWGERRGGIRYLTVLDRTNLSAGEVVNDPASEWYGQPGHYVLTSETGGQIKIHPSRLVMFTGNEKPTASIAVRDGWGSSVLASTKDSINRADSTAANIASLVYEAKVDVISIPDLMNRITDPRFEAELTKRFGIAATMKGINGMLILDAGETYEQKSPTLATLPDILMGFMQLASGDSRIPATLLLGQAPQGMNSTGDGEYKNYLDRVSSEQTLYMTPAMYRLDECLIRSALGSRPETIYYVWSPLWHQSEKEKAEIFKMKVEAARQMVGTGTGQEIVPREAVSDALVNTLIEDGSMPGLEAAIAKHGDLSEQEPSEEETAAAAAAQAANTNNVTRMQAAANDAAPRTLYVRRDVINRADIVRWATEQGFTDIVPDLHVTIAYSRQMVDWFKVGTSWADRLEIGAGGPRQMDSFGTDGKYKVLLITAPELVWRHREIIENGASWDHEEYQPHISIQIGGDVDLSKVEPYRGKIVLGPEIFEELRID